MKLLMIDYKYSEKWGLDAKIQIFMLKKKMNKNFKNLCFTIFTMNLIRDNLLINGELKWLKKIDLNIDIKKIKKM